MSFAFQRIERERERKKKGGKQSGNDNAQQPSDARVLEAGVSGLTGAGPRPPSMCHAVFRFKKEKKKI